MIYLQFEAAKIFKNAENTLTFVKYNSSVNYFDFIAEQCNKNKLRQVIVTSNIMINLISSLVVKYKFQLVQVEFMNDDKDLDDEIQILVDKSANDSSYYLFLLRKLQLLSDEQCIDILRLSFKKRTEGKSTQIKVQANGIFSINKTSFEKYAQTLLDIISDNKFQDNIV